MHCRGSSRQYRLLISLRSGDDSHCHHSILSFSIPGPTLTSYISVPILRLLSVSDVVSMADNIIYPRRCLHHGSITLPLPSLENLSDRALSDWGSVYDASITRPPQTFHFLGVDQSLVCPPRDLEEGRLNKHNYTSRETLIAEKTDTHDFAADSEKSSKRLIPTRHPVHGIHSTNPPAKKGPRLYRFLRWNYGSVYRRILCLAVLGNILAIILVLLHNFWTGSSL
jgi:hypothetical protein